MRYATGSIAPLATAGLLLLATAGRAQVAAPSRVGAGSGPALPPSPVVWTAAPTQPVAVTLAVGDGLYVDLDEHACGFEEIVRANAAGSQVWRVRRIPGMFMSGLPGSWGSSPTPATCVPDLTAPGPASNLPPDARIEASIAITSKDPPIMYGFRPVGGLAAPARGRTSSAGVRQAVLGAGQSVMLREGRVLSSRGDRVILTSDGHPVMDWPAAGSVLILSSSGQVAVRQRLGRFAGKIDR